MSRFDTVEHRFKLFPAVVLWFSAQTHILRHISLILSHSWCHKIICLSYFKRKIKSSNLFSHNTFCNNAFFSHFLSKLSFTATQFLPKHTTKTIVCTFAPNVAPFDHFQINSILHLIMDIISSLTLTTYIKIYLHHSLNEEFNSI